MRDPRSRPLPQMVAVGFWLRRAEVQRLADRFAALEEAGAIRVPRGLAFHVPPTNVDTVFMYSLIVSFLVGNRNLVRVSPNRPSEQATLLCELLRDVLAEERFAAFADELVVVSYSHEAEPTALVSQEADVRLLWGGDESIDRLRAVPVRPGTHDLTFGDRFSFAVLRPDAVLQPAQSSLHTLAEELFNDAYWFDQLACSSPRLLVWVGSREEVDDARRVLFAELSQVIAAKGYALEPGASISKLNFLYGAVIDRPVEGVYRAGNELAVIGLSDLDELRPHPSGRRAVLRSARRCAGGSRRVRRPQGPDARRAGVLRRGARRLCAIAAGTGDRSHRRVRRGVEIQQPVGRLRPAGRADPHGHDRAGVLIGEPPARRRRTTLVWEADSPPPLFSADLLPTQPPDPELPDLLQGAVDRATSDRHLERAPDWAAGPHHAPPEPDAPGITGAVRRRERRAYDATRGAWRVARGADDGYRSPLVIGLKSSTDAPAVGRGDRVRRSSAEDARARTARALRRGGGCRRRCRGAELAGVPDRSTCAPSGRRATARAGGGPVRGDRARPDIVGLGRDAVARRSAVRAAERPRPSPGNEDARGLPDLGRPGGRAGGRVQR